MDWNMTYQSDSNLALFVEAWRTETGKAQEKEVNIVEPITSVTRQRDLAMSTRSLLLINRMLEECDGENRNIS